MTSFEFLGYYFLNSANEAFDWSEATHEELTQLIDFGFDLEVVSGDVYLSKNKHALAKVIFENVKDEDEVSDVVEYRFGGEKEAIEEIANVYITENQTVKEIIDEVLTDWVLTDKEREQKKKEEADDYETSRHPDEKRYTNLFNDYED